MSPYLHKYKNRPYLCALKSGNDAIMENLKYLKPQNHGIATWLALAILPLSGFATDIYIPSLPSMTVDLGVTEIQVQLTISIFLISYGVSQLFIGSLVDSFGRYKISLYSLFIFGIASIVIATTHNIYVIYLMRFIHGLTTAAAIVSKRAFFVDIYEGSKLKHYLSMFTIIWSAGPIIAPFVGGYLQTLFGWESNFYALGILAIGLGLLEYVYSGETLINFTPFHLKKIVNIYKEMLGTLNFSLGIVMLGLSYSMVMIYNMTGAFIIEHHFLLSPVVAGYSSLTLGFAWMVGGFIGRATIYKPFIGKLSVDLFVQAILCITMILAVGYITNVYLMICFAFLIHITAGYVFNNYFTFCLGLFPKNAGIGGGLTGGITYVIVSLLCSTILTVLPAGNVLNLSLSYSALCLPSIIIMTIIYLHSKKPNANNSMS